jgi:hypothetical protein
LGGGKIVAADHRVEIAFRAEGADELS